jgi:hypothetical protein
MADVRTSTIIHRTSISKIINHVIGIRQSEIRSCASIRMANLILSTSFLVIKIEVVIPVVAFKLCAHRTFDEFLVLAPEFF